MNFCIFSFNRGRFLKNCISSIESCAPGHPITIFDDNSDDPETTRIIANYSEKHQVIRPDQAKKSRHQLGGLYGNMQLAFETFKDADLVCFLQDDTQMVRSLGSDDLVGIEQAFAENVSLAFVNPCFIRGINFTRNAKYSYKADLGLYFKERSQSSSGVYFSALLIMKPQRLKSAGWSFAASEPLNDKKASKSFMPMGYLYAPFAMWLPEVPAYRGKKKTIGLKLAEKKRNSGFYPFALMTEQEGRSLKNRDHQKLPVAEDFLGCESDEPPKPWAYNPLTSTGWIKTLNQLEVSIRRLLR